MIRNLAVDLWKVSSPARILKPFFMVNLNSLRFCLYNLLFVTYCRSIVHLATAFVQKSVKAAKADSSVSRKPMHSRLLYSD